MLKVVRSKGGGPAANGSCVASGHTLSQVSWSTWEVGPDSQCDCAPGQAGWEQASSLWQVFCGCELAWRDELAQWVQAWEVVCPSIREVVLAAAGAQAGHKCCAASCSSSAPFGETWGCHLQRPPRGSLAPSACSLLLCWPVRSHLGQFCNRADFDEQWDFCTGVRQVALAVLPWVLFAVHVVGISLVLFLFLPSPPSPTVLNMF